MLYFGNRLRMEKLLPARKIGYFGILMKLPIPALLVLIAAVAAMPLFAQSEAKKPADAPETALPSASPGAPAAQVRDFFRLIGEGRVDAAYEQLLKGTKIAELPKDVELLKVKTKEAIKAFGEVGDCELAEEKNVGKGEHLKRLTCLSLGKQFPIRWRFYFYNAGSSGAWKLIDIRIDDRLLDMFGESAPEAGVSAQ